ncbi:hypothetical protein Z043_117105, partial [Scleropages formosus]
CRCSLGCSRSHPASRALRSSPVASRGPRPRPRDSGSRAVRRSVCSGGDRSWSKEMFSLVSVRAGHFKWKPDVDRDDAWVRAEDLDSSAWAGYFVAPPLLRNAYEGD